MENIYWYDDKIDNGMTTNNIVYYMKYLVDDEDPDNTFKFLYENRLYRYDLNNDKELEYIELQRDNEVRNIICKNLILNNITTTYIKQIIFDR